MVSKRTAHGLKRYRGKPIIIFEGRDNLTCGRSQARILGPRHAQGYLVADKDAVRADADIE